MVLLKIDLLEDGIRYFGWEISREYTNECLYAYLALNVYLANLCYVAFRKIPAYAREFVCGELLNGKNIEYVI